MPSKSKKQHNFMEAIAHSPAFAKKAGVPQSVGKDFSAADKGKKFKGGGMAKSDMKEDTKMDMAQDKAMIKKAMKQHDMQEHKGGKGTKLALKKGGKVSPKFVKEMEKAYPKGATVSPMKKGGMTKGCGYASGGKVSQLAKANGIAKKGKSRGTLI
jgi:hypothetical protein